MALHFRILRSGSCAAIAQPNTAAAQSRPSACNFQKPERRDHLLANLAAAGARPPRARDVAWCAHSVVIHRKMSRSFCYNVALHFRKILTSEQTKSMTYLTQARLQL